MLNFKIETYKELNGNEISYCPERGGIITSLKLIGQEILYFDQETFDNINENVRGGIPILFPNAGELKENPVYPSLQRHGFARKSIWSAEEIENGFKETLVVTPESLKLFPYDFCMSLSGKFESETFVLEQSIINNEESKSMPIATGLHPYFKVKNSLKKDIKFNFLGGENISNQINIWGQGGTICLDNPAVKNPEARIEMEIPELGSIIIIASKEYKKIWLWSLPGKDFICLEPMVGEQNSLIDNPTLIYPGQTWVGKVSFELKYYVAIK